MTILTRKEIEEIRHFAALFGAYETNALCNLALKGLEVEKLTRECAAMLKIVKKVQSALDRIAQQGVTGGAFDIISREVNVAIAAAEEK